MAIFVVSLRGTLFAFGKCIECKISCVTNSGSEIGTTDGKWYLSSSSTKYSDGQTLSQSKYDAISSVCIYCFDSDISGGSTTCPEVSNTHKCTCSKREESILGLNTIIDEEVETLIEEGAIASVGLLAVAALVPPPLPMFPPLGLPQPLAFHGGITQAAGGGVLPSAALTVSNFNIIHLYQKYNDFSSRSIISCFIFHPRIPLLLARLAALLEV